MAYHHGAPAHLRIPTFRGPLGNFVHSFAGPYAQFSSPPLSLAPPRVSTDFPAVPARKLAPLFPSEACLACLGALTPRAPPILFHFSTTWATRVLFVQVPPRSCAEFHCAASADTRGHYPSPRLRCLGFFPPLHFLLQASRFCLMLGYRCLSVQVFPAHFCGFFRGQSADTRACTFPFHRPALGLVTFPPPLPPTSRYVLHWVVLDLCSFKCFRALRGFFPRSSAEMRALPCPLTPSPAISLSLRASPRKLQDTCTT